MTPGPCSPVLAEAPRGQLCTASGVRAIRRYAHAMRGRGRTTGNQDLLPLKPRRNDRADHETKSGGARQRGRKAAYTASRRRTGKSGACSRAATTSGERTPTQLWRTQRHTLITKGGGLSLTGSTQPQHTRAPATKAERLPCTPTAAWRLPPAAVVQGGARAEILADSRPIQPAAQGRRDDTAAPAWPRKAHDTSRATHPEPRWLQTHLRADSSPKKELQGFIIRMCASSFNTSPTFLAKRRRKRAFSRWMSTATNHHDVSGRKEQDAQERATRPSMDTRPSPPQKERLSNTESNAYVRHPN